MLGKRKMRIVSIKVIVALLLSQQLRAVREVFFLFLLFFFFLQGVLMPLSAALATRYLAPSYLPCRQLMLITPRYMAAPKLH